jgi:acetyl-CoA decarbonylase/synthase complex subunit gamma
MQVPAGLYALGRPERGSPVLVTGNFRLTFDRVRCDLAGRDCWIICMDTHGLDVGSAAAAGLLGCGEIAEAIATTRIAELVDHRDCVIPPDATVGMRPDAGLKASGFRFIVGPRRSVDLPSFIDERMTLTPSMQAASFTFSERLALTPGELSRGLSLFPGFAFTALLYAGLGPGGVNLGRAMSEGWQFLTLGLATIVCGCLIAPLLPPSAPRIPHFARGWAVGAAGTAALLFGARIMAGESWYAVAACGAFFPAAAAFFSLRFGAASPFATERERAREKRIFLSLGIVAAAVTTAALVLAKITRWGS